MIIQLIIVMIIIETIVVIIIIIIIIKMRIPENRKPAWSAISFWALHPFNSLHWPLEIRLSCTGNRIHQGTACFIFRHCLSGFAKMSDIL